MQLCSQNKVSLNKDQIEQQRDVCSSQPSTSSCKPRFLCSSFTLVGKQQSGTPKQNEHFEENIFLHIDAVRAGFAISEV